MDPILTIRLISPIIILLIIFYYFWNNISIHKNIQTLNYWFYFIVALVFFLLGFFVYIITPVLKKGDEILAEVSLGGSLVFLILGFFFYIEFWNSLYKKNSWLSKIFYLLAGATFILLIFHPWRIVYIENYGYTQSISEILLLTLFLEGLTGVIIFSQCIYKIKTRIKQSIESINSILENSIIDEQSELLNRKKNLLEKNIHLDIIIISLFLGTIVGMVGLLPKTFIMDSIGAFILFFPQVFYFSKDEELLLFLFSQRVQEDVKNLQKNIYLLHQSSFNITESQADEIESLMKFIEKADTIFYDNPKFKH